MTVSDILATILLFHKLPYHFLPGAWYFSMFLGMHVEWRRIESSLEKRVPKILDSHRPSRSQRQSYWELVGSHPKLLWAGIHRSHYNNNTTILLYISSPRHLIECARFTHPISLENRLSTRPDGFVSKKRIRVEMRPLNIPSCSCRIIGKKHNS